MNAEFRQGIRHGIPIALGYLSVSFAFGMKAAGDGLTVLQAVLISMTNLTSAGQIAALPLMVGGASLTEMALTQLTINLRYALMSLSLSRKLDGSMGTLQRLIFSGQRGGNAPAGVRADGAGHRDLRDVPGDHPAASTAAEAGAVCGNHRGGAEPVLSLCAGTEHGIRRICDHHLRGRGGCRRGMEVSREGGRRMKWNVFLPYLAVTAGVTYLIRMLPLTVFRKEIRSRFIRSFLAYIPYAVLGAMTFPDVFYSTGDVRTAVCGVAVAVLLALPTRDLAQSGE